MSTDRKASWGESSGRIVACQPGGDAPLTPQQQRVWFVESSNPGQPDYNICTAHRLRGPINEAALAAAFKHLVGKQDALRLRFALTPSGDVVQRLADAGPVLVTSDWAGGDEAALMAHLLAIRLQPFDLLDGPLCRAHLIRLGPDEAVFLFVGHHIMCDGWSMMVLSQQMASLYAQACQEQLAPMSAAAGEASARQPGYLDFARWQVAWLDGAQAEADVQYWLARLTPMPDALALVPERATRVAGEGVSRRVQVPVSGATLAAVRALARSLNVSLFAVMLAAYALMLARSTGQRSLVIGMPVKGRQDAEMADVIGFFANTLPLRIDVEPTGSFAALVARCDEALKDALRHAELPFERLLRHLPLQRHAAHHPVYQALFSYVDLRRRSDQWGELARSSISVPTFGGAEELSLLLIERAQDSVLECSFNDGVLPQALVARLLRRFQCVLDLVVAPGGAEHAVGTMPVLDAAERDEVQAWSQGPTRVSTAPGVWSMVRAQAALAPDAVALDGDVQSRHYGELIAEVAAMAHALRARGVCKGSRVALCLPQGPMVTQAIGAIWACRAAYVPLDPAHPLERRMLIMQDAQCDLLITTDAVLGDGASQPGVPTLTWSEWMSAVAPADAAAAVGEGEGEPQDVAYVMYTSGSTGQPKGVVVTQGAVVNLLLSMRDTLGVVPSDRWLAVTTPAFDISVLESFLPLSVGATLCWATSEQAGDGEAIAARLRADRISCLQATPAAWRLILASGWRHAEPGRFLALIGGETLPMDLAEQMLACGLDVWNMYGPTETTVWSACARITADALAGSVDIGHPIANTTVLVLDEAGELCAPGCVGHLHIGGAGLAQGYWQREELNARQFVTVHGPLGEPMPVFATGDLGYWALDGRLHCLGRVDRQIKWRGFRIEPDEIESCLMKTGLFQAAVVKLRLVSHEPGLVAFLEGPAQTPADLRQSVSRVLPGYMVPSHWVALPAGMPRLPNGKVDHRALAAWPVVVQQAVPRSGSAPVEAPLSELGLALRDVWRAVLQVQDVRPQDNFFDLGGHSLLALKACVQMEQRLGLRMGPQRYVFETFAQLLAGYEALAAARGAQPAADVAPPEVSVAQRIQQRIKGVFGRH